MCFEHLFSLWFFRKHWQCFTYLFKTNLGILRHNFPRSDGFSLALGFYSYSSFISDDDSPTATGEIKIRFEERYQLQIGDSKYSEFTDSKELSLNLEKSVIASNLCWLKPPTKKTKIAMGIKKTKLISCSQFDHWYRKVDDKSMEKDIPCKQ